MLELLYDARLRLGAISLLVFLITSCKQSNTDKKTDITGQKTETQRVYETFDYNTVVTDSTTLYKYPLDDTTIAKIIGWEDSLYGPMRLTFENLIYGSDGPLWRYYSLFPENSPLKSGETPLQRQMAIKRQKERPDYAQKIDSIKIQMHHYRVKFFGTLVEYEEHFNYGRYDIRNQQFWTHLGGFRYGYSDRDGFSPPELRSRISPGPNFVFRNFVVANASDYSQLKCLPDSALALENKEGIFRLVFHWKIGRAILTAENNRSRVVGEPWIVQEVRHSFSPIN